MCVHCGKETCFNEEAVWGCESQNFGSFRGLFEIFLESQPFNGKVDGGGDQEQPLAWGKKEKWGQCGSVLQRVAICCLRYARPTSALQCFAVCCRVLHCVAACCSVSSMLSEARTTNACVAANCNMLQRVAVCYLRYARPMRLLQCVAVRCSVLQCVAVCCSVLQCVAMCCSVLQCVAVCCLRYVRPRSVLQCVAVCCSVLQYVAVCCSVLQCVAVCCLRHARPMSHGAWMHHGPPMDASRHTYACMYAYVMAHTRIRHGTSTNECVADIFGGRHQHVWGGFG